MVAEIGQFVLILALVTACLQGALPLVGAARDNRPLMRFGDNAAFVQFAAISGAFACLTIGYVTSDFSILNVVNNSHSLKPMLYKISGVWGNHEGSLLLWSWILALFGLAVALFGRNLPDGLKARVLAIQGLIGVGFLMFILFTSNPFERVSPAPLDGNGLNPLLQDPGLAFHPPFLYLGYVGLSITFSFAIAALIEGRVDPAWARWVRPWTLAAWGFLTIGIALGSWWAYYELGWGGWWFWDPVENASFMPWLAATALLHSAIVVEKRDALKNWTILLAIIAFSLSLLGTFLVRSGVLNSVHAFASDPARGVFILIFLIFVIGGSLLLYGIRAPKMKGGGLFAPISREGALVLNNLLLSTITATVLLGTLYPIFLDAFTGAKVSVGPPYFNATFLPLAIPLAVAMAFGPFLAWKRGDLAGVVSRLKFALFAALAFTGFLWWWQTGAPIMALLGMGLFAWLLVGSILEWTARIKLFRGPLASSWKRMIQLPRSAHGMTVAHIGVALVILGITASETWQSEHLGVMRPGETVTVGGYEFRFDGAETITGPNYDAVQGTFLAYTGDNKGIYLYPEQRRYTDPPMETTEAAIRPMLSADLYTVIGEADGKGGYAVRIYHKPFISWIWIGAFVMFAGGAISLSDRRLRLGAPRSAKHASAATPVPSSVKG
ncbi:heme lyase CcmF/NrfE family subunit [uncultured Sneathiella sp.]|jgi:cytochrome c-type biogenesis protein CcmF|uniref:heme lyase CcmF/NrfE family subunit n=1 Tax=uncultured Sneathiella sp. TaxID=879315 RepID=UPI0030DAA56D|tara:strand:- start:18736 stop:20733 length:1998 start_codon:yes stop_codon:yes gene_type:complete